ncbi:hypothetical protein N7G274_002100 [Stereocaulon virgatum]|uniref:BZIP domain-containing protein n=1 Tax=Stereocaulon virgatum TaxID=373712 RepID=A0ABR4AJN9_9LECA
MKTNTIHAAPLFLFLLASPLNPLNPSPTYIRKQYQLSAITDLPAYHGLGIGNQYTNRNPFFDMSRPRLPLSPWIDDFDITSSRYSDSFDTPDLSIEYGGSGYIAPTSSPTQEAASFEPPSPPQQTPTFSAPEYSTIATISLPHRPRPETSSTPTTFPPLSIRSRPSLAPSPSPYGGIPSTIIPPSPIPTSHASLFTPNRRLDQDQNLAPHPYHAPDLSAYDSPSPTPATNVSQTLRKAHFPAPDPSPLTDREDEARRCIDTTIDEELSHQMSDVDLRLEQERVREQNSKAMAAISARHRRRYMRRIEPAKEAQRRVRMQLRMSATNVKAATKGCDKDGEGEKKSVESSSRSHRTTARHFRERWPLLVAEMRSRRERAGARRRGLIAGGGEGRQGDAQAQGGDEEIQGFQVPVPGAAMGPVPPFAAQDADKEDSWSMEALSPEEQRCSCNDRRMGALSPEEQRCSCNDERMGALSPEEDRCICNDESMER